MNVFVCNYSDDDMQSLASLMSLQQNKDCSDSREAADDVNVSDVANMADVADDDEVQTCQPILTDIRQLVSRSLHYSRLSVCLLICHVQTCLCYCCSTIDDVGVVLDI